MDKVVRRRYWLEGVENLAEIRFFVEQTALALGSSAGTAGDLVLAVDEAVTNIIVHGYANRPGEVLLEIRRDHDTFQVCIEDQAPAFDPTTVPEPNLDLPLEQRPPGGMGVKLIREFTDEIRYTVTQTGGNRLVLIKQQAVTDPDS